MDILEDFKEKFVLSKQRVLEEVDEWTLYHYYLGIPNLTIRTTYSSPIRDKDDSPSFSIFERTKGNSLCEYIWKDSAKNLYGDIFDLLCRMFSLSEKQVLEKISYDFCILEDSKDIEIKKIVPRPSKSETKIRIKAKHKFSKQAVDFWKSFYVSAEVLKWKGVVEVDFIWYNIEQQHPYKCRELTFAYPEFNHEDNQWHYQIYCPYADKEFKFRNDLFENQIYGWNHLEYKTENLIITKSNKDIICLKMFDRESVSPRSETTMIKKKTVELLKSKYKRVVTLFDNDEAGIEGAEKYDLPHLYIPIDSKCKDFSDFLKMYGIEESKKLLIELGI